MKELFIPKNFHAKSYALINFANKIIEEYKEQGFTLTLRQLYYQFVARDILPNKQRSYDNLGALISDARLAGLIDWDAIEDRTRFLRGHRTFDGPDDAVAETLKRYRIDMWEGQKARIEVWIEKDALIGVIERVCARWDVNYFACRGYASQSELYTAGKRIAFNRRHYEQDTIVLHLGDHDPSGCDMTRDNEDRLSMFAGRRVIVDRIALNYDQVEQYDPPPNPAKLTDTRAAAYVEEYGEDSWELDALEPRVIAALIEDKVKAQINDKLWQERVKQFASDKDKLQAGIDFVAEPQAYRRVFEDGEQVWFTSDDDRE